MGIYSDIQADLKDAMDGDLADAVATLTIIEKSSSTSYDPVVGNPSDTPVTYTMRSIVVDADLEDEQKSFMDTTINDIEVMVLDTERTCEFVIGMWATVRGKDYIIAQYKVDPAGATHNLQLRRR